MDFTIRTYKRLLTALKEAGYTFQPFAEFIENPAERSIILRHDVDAKKWNSYRFAQIQAGMEIKGTYYFRIVRKSWDRRVIREIAVMGHEIGYHYETMDKTRGDIDRAYDEFQRNLKKFRRIIPVKTICMHGSPLSKYDNRSIWEKYDYKELGIIGEPYFDVDFNKVLYLTDTGRRWDGSKVSVRDKVWSPEPGIWNSPPSQSSYRNTNNIIKAANADILPNHIMLTFHPQRWTDKPLPWLKELIWQNVKNQVKKFIVK